MMQSDLEHSRDSDFAQFSTHFFEVSFPRPNFKISFSDIQHLSKELAPKCVGDKFR